MGELPRGAIRLRPRGNVINRKQRGTQFTANPAVAGCDEIGATAMGVTRWHTVIALALAQFTLDVGHGTICRVLARDIPQIDACARATHKSY